MRQAWVDFNDVDDHRTTTLLEYLEKGVDVHVGASLTVGDFDGNLCEATVTAIRDDVVELALHPGTFTQRIREPERTRAPAHKALHVPAATRTVRA